MKKLQDTQNQEGYGEEQRILIFSAMRKNGDTSIPISKLEELKTKTKSEKGFTKEQVQEIGFRKVFDTINKNAEMHLGDIDLDTLKNKTSNEIQGYSKSRSVYGRTKNFDIFCYEEKWTYQYVHF